MRGKEAVLVQMMKKHLAKLRGPKEGQIHSEETEKHRISKWLG